MGVVANVTVIAAIFVKKEHLLPAIATLGDMVSYAGQHEAAEAGHGTRR